MAVVLTSANMAEAAMVSCSHRCTMSFTTSPIASISLAVASYSLTMASAESLPISVTSSRWLIFGNGRRRGTPVLDGVNLWLLLLDRLANFIVDPVGEGLHVCILCAHQSDPSLPFKGGCFFKGRELDDSTPAPGSSGNCPLP